MVKISRKLQIFPAALALAIAAGSMSCSGDSHKRRGDEVSSLYSHSVSLIKSYTDSMKLATDSARVNALAENLEIRLTSLNFKYPADTDLLMTEGENDTLAMMVSKFVKLKKERLYQFAHPIVRSDSDSVKNALKVVSPAVSPSHNVGSQNQR